MHVHCTFMQCMFMKIHCMNVHEHEFRHVESKHFLNICPVSTNVHSWGGLYLGRPVLFPRSKRGAFYSQGLRGGMVLQICHAMRPKPYMLRGGSY